MTFYQIIIMIIYYLQHNRKLQWPKLIRMVHCVKSVQIRTRKTPYLDTFHAVVHSTHNH